MRIKLRYAATKVRAADSGKLGNHDAKFTGTVTYSVVGSLDGIRVRLALGTESQKVAAKRVEKIQSACAGGPESTTWPELEDCLPVNTFKFFADHVGYVTQRTDLVTRRESSWADLCQIFEIDMTRRIANKLRGATAEEGVMADGTRDRYRQTIRTFTVFLKDSNTLLDDINSPTIELYKVERHKQIAKLKHSRGGSSVALDIAILHCMFAFALRKKMMVEKPIDLRNESKPGKNPKNGARPFTAAEIAKLREFAGNDRLTFLVLRWTGLRGSDAVRLQWQHVRFDQGFNGEIHIVTQKRNKLAIIPLSSELRMALEQEQSTNGSRPDDFVLCNPETGHPFSSRHRLYERWKAVGIRAGVRRVTPHCFRDTFACDMLARGASIFDVAKMLADTVDTVERYYASFVPAARDAAQYKMDHGLGIEERAELTKTRGKVAMFPTVTGHGAA